jgi:ubiquinol-cytochrome c reductase cytochrome c subunit
MALSGAAQGTAGDSAAFPTIVLPDVAAADSRNVGADGKLVASAAGAGSTAAGEKVFQLCAACHGTHGEGGAGANLQTSKRDLAAIIAYIKAPTGAMPKLYPAPLSDADVSAVAAYVMTLRH